MTMISEKESLTREEKFVALVHLYAELRLPFDAALDAAEADLLYEQHKGPKRDEHIQQFASKSPDDARIPAGIPGESLRPSWQPELTDLLRD
jgi:hypothetical protein